MSSQQTEFPCRGLRVLCGSGEIAFVVLRDKRLNRFCSLPVRQSIAQRCTAAFHGIVFMIRALFFAAGSVVYGFAADFEYSRSRSVRKYNSRAISNRIGVFPDCRPVVLPLHTSTRAQQAERPDRGYEGLVLEMASGKIFVLYSFCIAAWSSVTACVRSLRV